jgi:hypothetical protein
LWVMLVTLSIPRSTVGHRIAIRTSTIDDPPGLSIADEPLAQYCRSLAYDRRGLYLATVRIGRVVAETAGPVRGVARSVKNIGPSGKNVYPGKQMTAISAARK